MGADYIVELDGAFGAWICVEFTTDRRQVTDYAVALLVEEAGQVKTVRLYDGAHSRNELHRHTRTGGKQAAEVFHRGTLGEGMRSAIDAIKHGYGHMIEAWRT
ncbi:MAG: hypothetical protein ACLPUT_01645 [Solirubrobacteraceae bacterium]